jgi:hypothetical protein
VPCQSCDEVPAARSRGHLALRKNRNRQRIALDMQGSAQGVSLEDICTLYNGEPLSRARQNGCEMQSSKCFPRLNRQTPVRLQSFGSKPLTVC